MKVEHDCETDGHLLGFDYCPYGQYWWPVYDHGDGDRPFAYKFPYCPWCGEKLETGEF